jgi:hypothetical protein
MLMVIVMNECLSLCVLVVTNFDAGDDRDDSGDERIDSEQSTVSG